jgi:membrane protease YdiL (CAAX protease family)
MSELSVHDNAVTSPLLSKKKVALWVALTILSPLLLTGFISSWYIGVWYGLTGHQGSPPPQLIVQSMFVGMPVGEWLVVFLWWWSHRRRARFSQLYMTSTRFPIADVLVGLALGCAWVAWYLFGGVLTLPEMVRLDMAKLASLPMSITAGLCEEFLYRGFFFWLILAAGLGKKSYVAVSAIAFGLAHIFWGPYGIVWTMILGLTFAMVVLWRRSIWAAAIAHATLNIFIEPGLFEKALRGGFNQ